MNPSNPFGTERRFRAAVPFVLITATLDMLAFGIMIPVLPQLVKTFMHGDTAAAARVYGLFSTAWAAMQFVFSPLQGAIADRYGRRPVILLSCFGLGVDFIFMAVAPSWQWLLVGRLISGMTSASFTVAGAYIADVTPPEKRGSAFGLLGATFGIGFVIGPLLGGFLGEVSPRFPFWFAAGLTLVNAIYGFFVLPESLAPENRSPALRWSRANPLGSLRLIRENPGLPALAGIEFLFQIAHYVLPSTCVLYASYRYHWDGRMVSLMLALSGVCGIIVQALLVKPAIARLGEHGAVRLGLAFTAAGLAGFGLADSGAGFLLVTPLFSLGGLFSSGMQAQMSRQVPPQQQGQLQGAIMCTFGIAGLFAPTLFTHTFALFISPDAPLALPGAPMLLAALLVGGALSLALFLRSPPSVDAP